MAKGQKTVYVCSECGYESPKWSGKCPDCNNWNTMSETIAIQEKSVGIKRSAALPLAAPILEIDTENEVRYFTGIKELDRVLGGGIVKGSAVLLSGEPGIGKSTILLQLCGKMPENFKILYVSGEESKRQLKLRAERLGIIKNNISVMAENDIQAICEYIHSIKPDIVIVDSIQTMNYSELSSSTGSVAQVRECTNLLMRTAKILEIPIFIVGHVNKDGGIAGPKVMEHIVDAVLIFEGDRNYAYRILRATKNRFGSTNEIGVFEMRDSGLFEVENPSAMLISGRVNNVSGTSITSSIEGTRPILAEIQALVTTTGFGTPRRMSTGFDYNRLNLILAVLEKRLGYFFSNLDVYLNIVGGLRIEEPAIDLSVVIALVSGLKDRPISPDTIVFGEIGLAGEIRSVPRVTERILEAERMGFKRCIMPFSSLKQCEGFSTTIELVGVKNIREAVNSVF